jgi:hypothetical protein
MDADFKTLKHQNLEKDLALKDIQVQLMIAQTEEAISKKALHEAQTEESKNRSKFFAKATQILDTAWFHGFFSSPPE